MVFIKAHKQGKPSDITRCFICMSELMNLRERRCKRVSEH